MIDDLHLKACMQWLVRAQEVNEGGGVAAIYYMDTKQWHTDYPETTGYIIPTFIAYAYCTHDEEYLNGAIAMGDWLIEIQLPNGGAGEAAGVTGKKPQIFNTSQVILGWLALYMETFDRKYLDAARKAGDWIISNQELNGSWIKSTYAGAKAYHIRTAWALMELHHITEEEKYCTASELSFNWVLSQAHKNGWFRNNKLGKLPYPSTHLIGYTLVGLQKISHIGIDKTLTLLHNAAKGLTKEYCSRLPGTIGKNWDSNDDWSCLTGNAQIAFFLHRIPEYKSSANTIVNDLQLLQFICEKDPNLYGGLPGSWPIRGLYLKNAIPNWGVKFFADCLLQRLIPYHEQKYLG